MMMSNKKCWCPLNARRTREPRFRSPVRTSHYTRSGSVAGEVLRTTLHAFERLIRPSDCSTVFGAALHPIKTAGRATLLRTATFQVDIVLTHINASVLICR